MGGLPAEKVAYFGKGADILGVGAVAHCHKRGIDIVVCVALGYVGILYIAAAYIKGGVHIHGVHRAFGLKIFLRHRYCEKVFIPAQRAYLRLSIGAMCVPIVGGFVLPDEAVRHLKIAEAEHRLFAVVYAPYAVLLPQLKAARAHLKAEAVALLAVLQDYILLDAAHGGGIAQLGALAERTGIADRAALHHCGQMPR